MRRVRVMCLTIFKAGQGMPAFFLRHGIRVTGNKVTIWAFFWVGYWEGILPRDRQVGTGQGTGQDWIGRVQKAGIRGLDTLGCYLPAYWNLLLL
jgi:hypothetical protein